uniref:Uncharacterized protein n=1 Tax=Leersia perrieri TaxID=77586 RepID=A0A0D9WRL2_9ORYZ
MVVGAAAVERGGRDVAGLHAERLRIQELQEKAFFVFAEAETARDTSRVAHDITVARVELARECETTSKLSNEINALRATLTSRDEEVRASQGCYDKARLVLHELNNWAISTIQALVHAFGSIKVQGRSLPPNGSTVSEKL